MTPRVGLLPLLAGWMIGSLIFTNVVAGAAAKKKPAVLPLTEALKLARNQDGFRTDRKISGAVLKSFQAFRRLPPKERAKQLPVLEPTVGHFSEYCYGRGNFLFGLFNAVGEPALPFMIQAFKSTDKKVRADARRCLPGLGKKVPEALVPLLASTDAALQLQTIQLFQDFRIGGHAVKAIPVLVKMLDTGDSYHQQEVAHALAATGERWMNKQKRAAFEALIPRLVKSLQVAKNSSKQVFLCRVFGGLGQPVPASVTAALTVLVTAPDLSVRLAAIQALGAVGGEDTNVLAALSGRIADGAEDPVVVNAALTALVRLSDAGRAAVAAALGNAKDDIAYQAARALSAKKVLAQRASFNNSLTLLTAALKSKSRQTRRFALFALARTGKSAASAGPALKTLLRDPDWRIRINAIEAVSRILPGDAGSLIAPFVDDPSPAVVRAAAGALAFLKDAPKNRDALLHKAQEKLRWRPRKGAKEPEYTPEMLKKYEIGGPLAGLKLPLFKTQYGEAPGYPGCIPELMKQAESREKDRDEWHPQGMAAEVALYPGSVEHWRGYWFKYCPQRSFYDQQSLLKNWVAPALPGARKDRMSTYAEPVYWVPRFSAPQPTGKLARPVPVVQTRVGDAPFTLDLGKLKPGLYTIRVIGAVAEKAPRQFMEPLYVNMTVNDGLDGSTHAYRNRCGYVDQFYGVAELSFHAVAERNYRATVSVGQGSRVTLLIHNIELHDALAGCVQADLKTRSATVQPPAKLKFKTRYLTEDRRARDASIWRSLGPINKQPGRYDMMLTSTHFQSPADVVRPGLNGLTLDQIRAKYGDWKRGQYPIFLINRKLGLVYSYAEWQADKPLPDPYPFKDEGAGLYQAAPNNPKRGQAFIPIGTQVEAMQVMYGSSDRRKDADAWVKDGNLERARDEALRLIRIAYRCPAIESSHSLSNVISNPGIYGRDSGMRRRQTQPQRTWLSQYPNYRFPVLCYDKLFTYIDGNEDLARSVGRFVPWVKTSRDLVKLLDTYLVQTVAKRILRYHYYTSHSAIAIADVALVMDRPAFTRPWIDWLFSRAFDYPAKIEGLQDLSITNTGRSGCSYIGSSFYAAGEGASTRAANVEKYIKAGIFPPEYDLRREDLYPKCNAHLRWQDSIIVGGHDFTRIGDVTGAEREAFTTFRAVARTASFAWRNTGEASFAWVLKNVTGRQGESDTEWQAIEQAASTVKRAPWLDLHSRAVYNWAGILESGLQYDDYRFRNAAYLRTGIGWGHHHNDALDLQVVSLGLPMTIDGGQRPGYSSPGDRSPQVHNLVLVNDGGNNIQSWVNDIQDTPGARSLLAEAAHETASVYQRRIRLVDVDPGKGAQPLPVKKQLFGAKLPTRGIEPATAYLFDVFRVRGGNMHTYCFHGPVSDQVQTTAQNMKPVAVVTEADKQTPEQAFLAPFRRAPKQMSAGDAGETVETLWRYARKGIGSESRHANYDSSSPRKFLKLTLFNTRGQRVLRARSTCHARHYVMDHVFVQRRFTPATSPGADVFTAIIEPYAGNPVISEKQALPIADNDPGVTRAVAVAVKTRNGHRDILFDDGAPQKIRAFADMRVAAASLFYSTDKNGLRLVAMGGGRLLETPILKIATDRQSFVGRILAVNYRKKQITINRVWPQSAVGAVFTIRAPGRKTSYTIRAVKTADFGSVITVTQGADYYRSMIEKQEGNTLTCRLNAPMGMKPGLTRGLTAFNDAMTKHWHVDYMDNGQWRFDGPAPAKEDFAQTNALKLWEYGPGDTVELTGHVSLQRIAAGAYRITGNTPCVVSLKTNKLQISMDNQHWQPAPVSSQGGWASVSLKLAQSATFLRIP